MASHSRVFDRDPLTGVVKLFHWDDIEDRFAIETRQDAEPLLDLNKAQHASVSDYRPFKRDLHRVASLPMHVYWDLKERGIIDDQTKFRAWLNDPDNRYFRTMPGRV